MENIKAKQRRHLISKTQISMKNRELNFGPLKRGVLVPYGKYSFLFHWKVPSATLRSTKQIKLIPNKGSNCNRNVTYSLIFKSCPNEREKKQKKSKGIRKGYKTN